MLFIFLCVLFTSPSSSSSSPWHLLRQLKVTKQICVGFAVVIVAVEAGKSMMEDYQPKSENAQTLQTSSIPPVSAVEENDSSLHSLELFNARACRCGCIPTGMFSLFEMAEKRKEFNRKKKEAEEKEK